MELYGIYRYFDEKSEKRQKSRQVQYQMGDRKGRESKELNKKRTHIQSLSEENIREGMWG